MNLVRVAGPWMIRRGHRYADGRHFNMPINVPCGVCRLEAELRAVYEAWIETEPGRRWLARKARPA